MIAVILDQTKFMMKLKKFHKEILEHGYQYDSSLDYKTIEIQMKLLHQYFVDIVNGLPLLGTLSQILMQHEFN